MTELSDPATLLTVWERAAVAPPAARTAVLVHGSGLVERLDDALDLDLGRCVALASAVYEDEFGATVDAVAVCPGCGELAEAVLPARIEVDAAGATREVGPWTVRALTSRDLLVAAQDDEPARALLERCVRDRSTGAPPRDLSDEDLDAIDRATEELAAAAGVVTVLPCPACGAVVDVALDPGSLLWDRVAEAGTALLHEVASLAAAFGWGEDQVLALTASRRQAYLALAAP